MRLASLFFVAVWGCAHPAVVATPAPAPQTAICPPPPAPSPSPVPAAEVTVIEPDEAALVLKTLFPKHLKDLRECKKGRQPTSWVEVDDVALLNLDRGQFVPVVESRELLTSEGQDEIRFTIRLDNCEQDDDETMHVEAVFDAAKVDPAWRRTMGRKPRPKMQREY